MGFVKKLNCCERKWFLIQLYNLDKYKKVYEGREEAKDEVLYKLWGNSEWR